MPFPHSKQIVPVDSVETFDISEVASEVSIDIVENRVLKPGEYAILPEDELTLIPPAILTNSTSQKVQKGFLLPEKTINGKKASAIYGSIAEACLFTPYQLIVKNDGRFLYDEHWLMPRQQCWNAHDYAKLAQQLNVVPQKTESNIFRATIGHSSNYGHFIFNSLPLGRVLNRFLPSHNLVSSIFAPAQFIHDFFQLFKPRETYLSNGGIAVEAKEVHFVMQLTGTSIVALDYVRQESIKNSRDTLDGPIALYLSRKGYRRSVENEEELIPVLNKYNITFVETQNLSVVQQIELFRKAYLIIGAWGAALCNCVFMPEKSIIIELCDPFRFEDTYFMEWAASARCNYVKVVGVAKADDGLGRSSPNPSQENFVIQPELLDEVLEQFFSL